MYATLKIPPVIHVGYLPSYSHPLVVRRVTVTGKIV
jgi:hypothetical protein